MVNVLKSALLSFEKLLAEERQRFAGLPIIWKAEPGSAK